MRRFEISTSQRLNVVGWFGAVSFIFSPFLEAVGYWGLMRELQTPAIAVIFSSLEFSWSWAASDSLAVLSWSSLGAIKTTSYEK